MLYCSASFTRSAFKNGEPGGYNGTTIPPCRMGCGAYGASVTGAGFGTAIGAGSGGSFACCPKAKVVARKKQAALSRSSHGRWPGQGIFMRAIVSRGLCAPLLVQTEDCPAQERKHGRVAHHPAPPLFPASLELQPDPALSRPPRLQPHHSSRVLMQRRSHAVDFSDPSRRMRNLQ